MAGAPLARPAVTFGPANAASGSVGSGPQDERAYRTYIGHIQTMDPENGTAEAFAVLGDTIIAVGSVEEVRASVPEGTPEAAVEGTVLPGLIDAHFHMQRGGLKLLSQLPEGLGLDEFLEGMARIAHDPTWKDGSEEPTIEDRVAGLVRIQPYLRQLGFTGIVDPAVTIDEFRGYQEAHRRGLLTIRVTAMPYLELGSAAIPDVEAAIQHLEGFGGSTGFGDDWLRIGPIKIYFDGEGVKGQALLNEPWNAAALADGSETEPYLGVQRIAEEDFERLVRWCAGHGWGVGVHAVGGGAVSKISAVFAAIAAETPIEHLRFQLIHAYLEPTAQSMREAAEAGVIASLQPSLIWNNAVGLRERLGDRVETANPVRSWLDAGVRVALGSDGPFFAFDPRMLVAQTVERFVKGADAPLALSEAISRDEALVAYTRDAAYTALREDRVGMIRVGFLADWITGFPAS